MLIFSSSRNTPVIRQAEASECGLACIAMIANFHNLNVDMVALRRRYQTSLKGSSLKNIIDILEEIGFSTRPIRCELEELGNVRFPCIVHWNLNHFVVLTKISRGYRGVRYHINDPALGSRIITSSEFSSSFTGIIIDISKGEHFSPYKARTSLSIKQLWSKIDGLFPLLREVFALSLILQIANLAAPFFLQISVDRVIPSSDSKLLLMLTLGFSGVAIIYTLTNWLRSITIIRLSSSISYQLTINLARHLLRLPLPWFERRHVGDIISRFSSTRNVSEVISNGLVAAVLDGLMAIATLFMIVLFAPTIALIALLAMVLIFISRLGFFAAMRHANVSLIMANAAENSTFIETIRGICTIKSFGEESNRHRLWQDKKTNSANSEIKTGHINANFSAIEKIITSAEAIIFVYVSVTFALYGKISVGAIFALQSYRQQFLEASSRFIQQIMNYRLLDMHLARIADIALSEPERLASPSQMGGIKEDRYPRRIEMRNVWFRYAPSEPDILRDINIVIEPGEMIALIGPSGGGKTTLLKIMLGLIHPTYGEVLIDGQPMSSFGIERWRKEIGCIFQDDMLFAGSIADNICLFDHHPDNELMENVSSAANIAAEIKAFPMQYHTLVGDMGSVLSGGQKQRVILARALYRRPSALFLDEATSHLDPKSEAAVVESLGNMSCTRIAIAHRPQTLKKCDHIYVIENGRCVPLPQDPQS